VGDVAILGGGIIGLTAARQLAKKGREVCVFDMPVHHPSASWAGGGILSPLYPWRYPDAVTALTANVLGEYQHLASEMRDHAGFECELNDSGMIVFPASEQEFDDALQWSASFDVDIRQVTAQEVAVLQPGLNSEAIFLPKVGSVRNPHLLEGLRQLLRCAYDVQLITDKTTTLTMQGDGRVVVKVAGVEQNYQQVLVAAGVWSASLLQGVGVTLPLDAVKGEMLMYQLEKHEIRKIILGSEGYLIPRADGKVLVGSTVEKSNEMIPVAQSQQQLMEVAEKMHPSMQAEKLMAHWAGLRPASSSGTPWMSGVPGFQQLFISTGHFRNGLVAALRSSECIADLMCGTQPKLNMAEYALH
jgi:glycine oxidase